MMNERKRNVLSAAQRLFIEKGFQSTSIQDILNEAKISKGTFYNYFNSKQECLIAMIDHGVEEVKARRRKLLSNSLGRDINSPEFLVEQIAIPWQVNRDENLAPIYEAIFQSGDEELKQIVTSNYLKEMDWLATRIVDIYGKDASPYSYDCSIMIHGIQKQMMAAWRMIRKEPFDMTEILRYVLKRMDIIVKQLIEQDDIFIGEYAAKFFAKEPELKKETEDEIAAQFEALVEKIDEEEFQEGYEYTELLLSEFQSDQPKIYIIEAIVILFSKVFHQTIHEKVANELTEMVWEYIEERKNRSA
ncbi:TetR/AcrR family transcriptional regulator [Bacillus sp. AGMB 02131]|uniref:TetR/AcrR family transcriptional regulator n=1 Tax=Peribacillus faecalis TaxID=2772559 RepID=A0A927HB68_9BACI|nr:TetR/AcrR family transcriptional regulator [Peribacillus faecalis]MBD3108186.1 TetR/AcrR family transcriptional regulator [Peribacillus faecalis]